MNKPNNPPAFPVHPDMEHESTAGMTLRDYFAGQALVGIIIASHSAMIEVAKAGKPMESLADPDGIAFRAGEHADAMLKERGE